MTEIAKVVLDARPGLLKGTITTSLDESTEVSTHEVNIPVEVCSPLIQEEILTELQNTPYELYHLLKGEAPQWLNDLLPSSADIWMEAATCNCGDLNCQEVLAIREYAEQQLSADPLMKLTLMGLPRQELMSGVLGAWSASTISEEKEVVRIEVSLMEEKGKTGPSAGEWLAEAAEQGRLHEPGPLFRDVTLNLTSSEEVEIHTDDWTPLLPGASGVQKALRLIMKKTSDIAEKRRRQFIKE